MWRRKRTAQDLRHTTSSVRHGEGSVMGGMGMYCCHWNWITHFFNDVTPDRSSRMHSDVFSLGLK